MAARKSVHFIGIGGIGISALARLYRSRGFRVSGSDMAGSEITAGLSKKGIAVKIGPHRASNIGRANRVIYTAAAKPSNPELREARRRGIETLDLGRAVGELTREYRTIAIAGAHGKSTTTALAALVLIDGGLDPTVQIGTILREFGNTNSRVGRSDFLVLEADEYRDKFLEYSPALAVVTNIDREHLDFHPDIRAIESAFFRFLGRLRPGGTAILNFDDPRLRRMARRLRLARPDVSIVPYSIKAPAAREIKKIIRIPGAHNVSNAMAAYACGRALRIPRAKILSSIARYRGSWRRFERLGKFSGADFIADYAHHPTEIKATLLAARELYRKGRVWCVFQPHHYERMRKLFVEFSRAFDDCDALLLLDVYEVAGREHGKAAGHNSEKLAIAVSRRGIPAAYIPDPSRLGPFLRQWLRPGDALLMMGAGSIWEITKKLAKIKRK